MTAQESVATTQRIHRDDAVARLRIRLIELTRPGQSTCQMAVERGVFCQGFRRYSNVELRALYGCLDPSKARTELESQANSWQLLRQAEHGTLTSCDAQWQSYESCHGWDDFSNDRLAEFCAELIGVRFEVVGEKTLPVI
jgi:hypothetical protein